MNQWLLSAAFTLLLALSHSSSAFEISGDSFLAEFDVTSVTSDKSGSVLTAEGDIDGYGRVFLTYYFEGVHGLTDLGHFTGQIRSVTSDGVMYGTLNGVYRMKSGKMHIHTFDTHSNGDIVMAIGSIDLVADKGSFTVYPE